MKYICQQKAMKYYQCSNMNQLQKGYASKGGQSQKAGLLHNSIHMKFRN